ncbi:MAG TPA: hypothetical protein DCL73_11750 [Treponema sp.]|nr:hypothetical protein [Treponema sp.]
MTLLDAMEKIEDTQTDRLTRVMGLKNGTPGADTIHCVPAMIDGKQLEKAFLAWTHGMFKANPRRKKMKLK